MRPDYWQCYMLFDGAALVDDAMSLPIYHGIIPISYQTFWDGFVILGVCVAGNLRQKDLQTLYEDHGLLEVMPMDGALNTIVHRYEPTDRLRYFVDPVYRHQKQGRILCED